VREDAGLLPAVEATRDGAPRTIPSGQVAPGSASTEDSEDPIEDCAVVVGGSLDLRLLGREQWLQPLPKVEFANTPQFVVRNADHVAENS
jgi:hypothetical protein